MRVKIGTLVLVGYNAVDTYWAPGGSLTVVATLPTEQWFRLGCPLRNDFSIEVH